MKKIFAVFAGLAFASAALAADDIWAKTINNDTNGSWDFQPAKPKAKYVVVEPAGTLPGDHAYRIKVTKGANPWDQQASSPVGGEIHEGDVVMVMYYARAAEPAQGGSKLTARIQMKAAPYTSIMDMTSSLSDLWVQYCGHRVATGTIDAKKGNVTLHLATADQVIELGPVFVFNLGKDYDRKTLKGCDD